MRWLLLALPTALLALAACVPLPGNIARDQSGRPDVVIVRSLNASPGIVVLDPSFGFSLHRGAPGVPLRARAASVGRAAAFELADAVTQSLRRLGLDALRSDTADIDPNRKTLIVHGVFRHIDEGMRRRVRAGHSSRVIADVQIDYSGPGIAPRAVLILHEDSNRLPREAPSGRALRAGMQPADANADAARLGRAIGQAIADLAHRENWLPPGR